MLRRNYWGESFIRRLLVNYSSLNGISPTMVPDTNVSVSRPASLTGTWRGSATTKDTAIRVTGIDGVAYGGSNYLLYNREKFETYVSVRKGGKDSVMAIPKITKKSQLVPFINIYYGMGLSPNEIIEGDVTTPDDGSTFTIRVDPIADNYQFNVGFDFKCTLTGYVATDTVKKVDLSGFVYPSADLTAQQAYVATYPISFTPEFATLSKLTVKSEVDQSICDILKKYVNPAFSMDAGDYSLSGAKITYAALNSSAIAGNPTYKYVVAIQLSNASVKMRGLLMLHFNEPFDLTIPPKDDEVIPG